MWIPGFGPLLVAGPLATAIVGGIEGAAAGAAGGGILGALVGWGVSKKHILKYEEYLKADGYLVIAYGSTDEISLAHNILGDTEPEYLDRHDGTSEA
ncbi:MAG: hypothetical protein H6672_16440 [Anaerolineaceae bacterium]|nr:hypothetical protein [Anaerolineaceae bacterium]